MPTYVIEEGLFAYLYHWIQSFYLPLSLKMVILGTYSMENGLIAPVMPWMTDILPTYIIEDSHSGYLCHGGDWDPLSPCIVPPRHSKWG